MTGADAPSASPIGCWQAAWPRAIDIWSRHTRLHEALLCETHVRAAAEGLQGSFAMIRLRDQSVVVDLEAVAELGLEDYAVEILAHEIGHHVLAPATVTDHVRLLARIRRGLPTLESYAPMVANLYADLLINDRLQRQSGLRLADIYRRLSRRAGDGSRAAVWNLYLRIYENLWRLPKGDLGARPGDDRAEGDAWLGARLVRVYANDWMTGAGRFAALLLHYLVEDAYASRQAFQPLLDTADAAAGCEPYGGIDIEPEELADAVHPAEDSRITGEEEAQGGGPASPQSAAQPSRGQAREPFEYGEILRSAGIRLDAHDMAVRYYRERAIPFLVPFPERHVPDSPEPLPEGLEPWEIGDPLDEIDWLQTAMQSPHTIPGLTTVRRLYGQEEGSRRDRQPVDLDLYVDSSGSMPNPQSQISWLSLAGAIIALSALRAGAGVQATLWSGKREYMHTPGFIRDERAILRVLTGFFGGGTCFPIHRLRQTFCERAERRRPAHILMISDDGIVTMFDKDEEGNNGWDVSARALAAAGGGGSMALNISADWEQESWAHSRVLQRASREQGWEISAISRMEDLVDFARAFSRRHYA